MSLATWWINDPLPSMPALQDFNVRATQDDRELATLARLPISEVGARRAAGHRPYVGYLAGLPVTYGWVATRSASIGELDLIFDLPQGDRYLWDFATLPAWQGRGLYPRLLQSIAHVEAGDAQRLWIIHAPENLPSGAGMHKAGFEAVGQLSFRADQGVGLMPTGLMERAQTGAELLGVPLIGADLSPCWCCASTARSSSTTASCWPPKGIQSEECTCATAIRRPIDHPSVHGDLQKKPRLNSALRLRP